MSGDDGLLPGFFGDVASEFKDLTSEILKHSGSEDTRALADSLGIPSSPESFVGSGD